MKKKYRNWLIILLVVIIIGFVFAVKNTFFNQIQRVKTMTTTLPAKQNLFLDANSLNLPPSYMGYTFTKLSSKSATLGNNSLTYGNKEISLTGTEWDVVKNGVTDKEFNQFKGDFMSFAQTQLGKLGWQNKIQENGKDLVPATGNTTLSSTVSYVKVADNKFQVIVLQANKNTKTCPCNVVFKVFLSNVESVNNLQ